MQTAYHYNKLCNTMTILMLTPKQNQVQTCATLLQHGTQANTQSSLTILTHFVTIRMTKLIIRQHFTGEQLRSDEVADSVSGDSKEMEMDQAQCLK